MSSEVELLSFLQRFFGDNVGAVKLATRDKEINWRPVLLPWPAGQSTIVSYIMEQDAAGKEVFFSPDLYKPELLTLPRGQRQLTRDNALGSRVICIDADGSGLPITAWDETGEVNGVPRPSLIVQSSDETHQHVYWFLDEFVTDHDKLENARKHFMRHLIADPSGFDVGQYLRPIGSTNFKYKDKNRTGNEAFPVFIEHANSDTYTLDALGVPNYVPSVEKQDINPNDLPLLSDVLINHDFPTGFSELFRRTQAEVLASRNDRSGALCAVSYYGAEAGLNKDEIYVLVRDADDRWEKYYDRSDRHKQLSRIVNIGLDKYPPGYADIEIGLGFAGAEVPHDYIRGWGDLKEDETLKMSWMFQDILPSKGYLVLSGAPGVGKTQLAMRLGVAAAMGWNFLNWENRLLVPAKTLFVSCEMGDVAIRHFITSMDDLSEHDSHLNQFLRFRSNAPSFALETKKGRESFNRVVAAEKPQLIIVDNLSKIVADSVSKDEIIKPVNQAITDVINDQDAAIVMLHHNRKTLSREARDVDINSLLGAMAIGAEADSVLAMVADGPHHVNLHTVKVRHGMQLDGPLRLERSGSLQYTPVEPEPKFKKGPSSAADFMIGMATSAVPTNSPGRRSGTQSSSSDGQDF